MRTRHSSGTSRIARGHDRRYSLDTTKIRSLGWQPRRDWNDGVRATIDWYRDNRDWWEPIKRSGGFREYYDKQYADASCA